MVSKSFKIFFSTADFFSATSIERQDVAVPSNIHPLVESAG